MAIFVLAIGSLILGALLTGGGLILLGEYKKVFFADPRATMSVEVLLQILMHPAATAPFVGAVGIFFGLWFLGIGLLIFLFPLAMEVQRVFNAALLSLGF
jgi:hypothetical protein